MNTREIKRGDIFMADLDPVQGSEQGGLRPVLVIQNNQGNRHSPTVIVAAMTTRKKSKLPTHVSMGKLSETAGSSLLMAEQLRTLDKRRLTSYLGHIDEEKSRQVDRALKVSLDLIKNEPVELSLCRDCAQQFYQSPAFQLRRKDHYQRMRHPCQFCGNARGMDYSVSMSGNQPWTQISS